MRAGASLANFAERGRIVPELTNPAIREVFVFKYRLQFKVDDARVLVVAFLHGARDFATWQEQGAGVVGGEPVLRRRVVCNVVQRIPYDARSVPQLGRPVVKSEMRMLTPSALCDQSKRNASTG